MASIKDIAERAGVSIATVSHVLNGTRPVRDLTRENVLRAVREVGYTINASARSLARGRSDIAGLIVSDLRNPFFPEIATAFQEQALLEGVDAIVMNANHDAQRALLCVQRLLGLNVSGIAILTSEIAPAVTGAIAARAVPAVYLDLGTPGRLVSNIVLEYEAGIAEAVEHLLALGHRRIGFLGGPAHWPSAESRRRAFVNGTAGRAETRVVEAGASVHNGYVACARLLAGFQPTAIAAFNDLLAIGALHCAHDRGMRIPADLSITGFDNIALAEDVYPPLTTVAVPRNDLGRIAFEALQNMNGSETRAGQEYRLRPSLIVRGSTAAPRARIEIA